MHLAQVPTSSPEEIGKWLVPFAAVLVIVLSALKIIESVQTLRKRTPRPQRDRADRYVRRSDIDAMVNDIKDEYRSLGQQFGKHELSTKDEYKQLGQQLSKHEDFTQRRLHDLADTVNKVSLKQAEQPNHMRLMIDASMTPMNTKMDQLVIAVSAMCAHMKIPMPAVTLVPPQTLTLQ